MNGAEALLRTLAAGGIDVCFANPGTSEMHLVEAFDRVPEIRPVLGLFEGVLSAAADGYARMTDRPALTLFHLGPGFANSIANMHNARRAMVPIVNLIGDHTIDHLPKDPPLASDIESLARPVSAWVGRNRSAATLAADGAEALAQSLMPPGRIATLIVPADSAWGEGGEPAVLRKVGARTPVATTLIRQIADVLRSGEPAALLVGTTALRERGLLAAGKIAAKVGARLLSPTFPARVERGAGRVAVERIPYFPERAAESLRGFRHIVLAGGSMPVPFFAYPTVSSQILPEGCVVHRLAEESEDAVAALEALVDELGAGRTDAVLAAPSRAAATEGPITPENVARVLAAHLPEGAIVSDEGITSSLGTLESTAGAPPHDWIHLTGGAIGQGFPISVGLAIACPGRRVLALQGDGAGMYTLQALWTQAREKLDVTTLVFANRTYAILGIELQRMAGAAPTERTGGLIDLGNPALDWVSLARGMGVEGSRVRTLAELHDQLAGALRSRGPRLIEVPIVRPGR